MYTSVGFKGELKELFESLDDLVQRTISNTKENVFYAAVQQFNSFFNNLDYSLYNKKRIDEIRRGVNELLPQYIDSAYGMYTEEPKVNASLPKLFGVFIAGGGFVGAGTALVLSAFAPALAPLGFFTGIAGGVYATEVVDEKLNGKYENFRKQKSELKRKCLSQIN